MSRGSAWGLGGSQTTTRAGRFGGNSTVRSRSSIPLIWPYDTAANIVEEPRKLVAALVEDGDPFVKPAQLGLKHLGQARSLLRQLRHRRRLVEQEPQGLPDDPGRQCGGKHAADVTHAQDVVLGEAAISGLLPPGRQQPVLLVVPQHPHGGPRPGAQLPNPHTSSFCSRETLDSHVNVRV